MTAPEHSSQQIAEINDKNEELITDELVVEEVSIDGMCGVY